VNLLRDITDYMLFRTIRHPKFQRVLVRCFPRVATRFFERLGIPVTMTKSDRGSIIVIPAESASQQVDGGQEKKSTDGELSDSSPSTGTADSVLDHTPVTELVPGAAASSAASAVSAMADAGTNDVVLGELRDALQSLQESSTLAARTAAAEITSLRASLQELKQSKRAPGTSTDKEVAELKQVVMQFSEQHSTLMQNFVNVACNPLFWSEQQNQKAAEEKASLMEEKVALEVERARLEQVMEEQRAERERLNARDKQLMDQRRQQLQLHRSLFGETEETGAAAGKTAGAGSSSGVGGGLRPGTAGL
jgi:hypothetical protein